MSLIVTPVSSEPAGSYDDFETPETCSECHMAIHTQWQHAMMSQSYTHEWDEIEYFKLAVPHAEKDEKVAEVKAGCNGCHAPLAFHAGDIPPPRPSEGSRANEGVSCDVCHTVTGFTGDTPFNFNFISSPGETKYGPRKDVESGGHEVAYSDFLSTPEFCGTCHNEKDPYGIWVKSTHLEWKEGPYAAEGIRCHDCHMTTGRMQTAEDGNVYDDARLHLFHGAHDDAKVRGTVEIRIYPEAPAVKAGEKVNISIALFNQKAGHKFPTGSVEDRIVWLHVEAVDASGRSFHLPVTPKGFEGEEYTIGADEFAYQDMGIALDDPDFAGVQRDGIPIGDRIFRMAYFDPQGRMTIQQWNTASLGVDYRFGPRETKLEEYSFTAPADIAAGPVTLKAVLYYQKLVKPVADFLGVPEEASRSVVVNEQSVMIEVGP
ncbi:MAG: multiheme c-type cytochrome [bacterium]|nr:multiheme c-type cytochrome [bacterium]